MEIENCFNFNNKYRNVRLATDKKLKEIQNLIVSIKEYQRLHPESDVSELKLPHTIDDITKFLSNFDEYDPKKRYAFIRGLDGKYICCQNGERSMTFIERPVPLGWEVFCMEELGDTGKITLKSRGKYVSSENGERAMRCNRENVGEREKFVMIQREDIYAFLGNNGKFVTRSNENDTLSCTCENDALSFNEKFIIEWIADFADEINISWKHYNSYFTNLCKDYDNAVEEKKNIDPENYYILNELEVYHNGCGNSYFTSHQQKIFNQKEFKAAMQKADEMINKIKEIIRDQNNFLSGILFREKSLLEKVTRMLNKFAPVIDILDDKSVVETSNANSS